MIEIIPRISGARLEVAVSGAPEPIWYEWRGAAPFQPPRNHDFALLGALAWAMRRGGRAHVRGAVDRRLLANVEKFSEIWATWRPDLFRVVAVSADDECAPAALHADGGHAFALSGGLDSAFSLSQNAAGADGRRTRKPGAAYLMEWRADDAARDPWVERAQAHASRIADALQTPFFVCATNWRAFSADFFVEHALGIIAAAHCLNGFAAGCVLAADAMYVDEYKLAPLGNNHTTNPLLSSSMFEVMNYGGAYRRMEKMQRLAKRRDLMDHIVVCHEKPAVGVNCGRCEKCVRSALELFVVAQTTAPFRPTPPSPWSTAWMKPLSESSLVFWREMRRRWPAGHRRLRAGVDALMWRSELQHTPLLRALKAAEIAFFRRKRGRRQ